MKVLCPLSIRKADKNFLACCVYADRGYKNFNQLRSNIFRVNSLYLSMVLSMIRLKKNTLIINLGDKSACSIKLED